MKRLSYLPLLCTLFAGCSAPTNTVANAANAADPAATNTAATDTATANTADAPTAAPTKTYVVKGVDKLGPGIPPEIQEALKKAAVPPPPLNTKLADKVKVVLETSRGPITLELDAKAAPLHVRSFVYLAGKGFFDGTSFHRYADLSGDGKGFIIQGGDPLSKKPATRNFAGVGGPGYEIPREYNDLKHEKLVIAAARSQDPDSAGSQFYITQGAVPFLDEGYTVFGKVVDGKDAAMKLRQDDSIKSVKLEK